MTRSGTTVQHAAHHPVRRMRPLQPDRTRSRAARLLTLTRRRQRALLGAAAALALLCPAAPASASWPRAERAQALAAQWWHATPACGDVTTSRAETDTLPPSYWQSYLPPIDNWVGIGDQFACAIYLRRSWLQPERPPWRMFCLVYLHEYGHVLGHKHPEEGAPLRNRYDRIMVPGTGFLPRACR